MKTVIYSIQHTGTRFTKRFFSEHGTPLVHRHIRDPKEQEEHRRIIPVRNPYDCLLSWRRRRKKHFDFVSFVSLWGEYIMRTENMDAYYFPLDVRKTRRQHMLLHALNFAGFHQNRTIIKSYGEEWRPVSPSVRPEDRAKEVVPEKMIEPLKFAYEWYEHYTKNYGAYLRAEDNMFGDEHGGS
jgi:hypothetical protein